MSRSAISRGRLLAGLLLVTGIAACDTESPLVPVVTQDVLLVTQPDDFVVFFASEYRGEVVLDEAGCFRLDLEPPSNATVIWPSGTSLWARGDNLELQDTRGRQIVALGNPFRFIGGFVAGLGEVTDLSPMEAEDVRMRCPGSFWLFREGSARRISG